MIATANALFDLADRGDGVFCRIYIFLEYQAGLMLAKWSRLA